MKNLIKYILFLLGLRKTIPAFYINKVKINENNEKLVLVDGADLFFCADLQGKKVYLRETLCEKIKIASKTLPTGCFFKIYSAYRSRAEQEALWNYNYNLMKQKNPDADETELTTMTKAVCADPRFGFGGHQTGGAVDISLCDKDGNDFDMGTAYLDTSEKIRTDSKEISEIAQKNRNILRSALENVGLVNYPNEWWHFCYGDRMWAAYKRKRSCQYGMIEESPEK